MTQTHEDKARNDAWMKELARWIGDKWIPNFGTDGTRQCIEDMMKDIDRLSRPALLAAEQRGMEAGIRKGILVAEVDARSWRTNGRDDEADACLAVAKTLRTVHLPDAIRSLSPKAEG